MIWLLLLAMLLFLVGVHEGGHFLAAKLLGVAVEEFALGFGPVLFSRKKGETRYSIRLLPLGGFVRLAGEEGLTSDVPFERTYYGRPAWVRLLVSLAGPLANIVLAGVLATCAILGFGLPRVQVAGLIPGEPAEQALRVGDVVLEIGGKDIWLWDDVGPAIQAMAPGPVSFEIVRDGERLQVDVTPKWHPDEERYLVGAYFTPQVYLAKLTELAPNSPLAQAGLKAGDLITAACGRKVQTLFELYDALADDCREVTVLRGGEAITVSLPARSPEEFLQGAGFAALPQVVERPGPGTAVALASRQLARFFVALAEVVRGLVRGTIPAGEAVAGPVGMAGLLSQGIQAGGLATLFLIAFISLNLALFNLIPFPALDGARMAFALFEIVSRRKVSPAVEAAIHALGFVLLLGLLLLITYRDIMRLFG